jgi:hemoglobin/transferrin/lactoferrin receptor protein
MKRQVHFNKTALAAALSLSFCAFAAQAAETYKSEDVVVTASRVEQQLADVNMSVSVITSEQIQQDAGATTIADLLESTVPGIRVNNDGGQGIDRIKIRGENSFRTVVMIDGQRISEQKSMSGVPLLIDPSQVERIEVIRGPASVLYGSDAIGGAINIITKKGGTKPIEGSVSIGFNSSNNGKDGSAQIYGGTNGWKYRIGAAASANDNLDTPLGEMPNTDSKTKSANAFLSYDIDPNKTVGVSFNYHDLEFMSADYTSPGFYVDVPEWERMRGAAFAEFKNISENFVRLRLDTAIESNKKQMQNHVVMFGPYMLDNFADNKLTTSSFNAQTDWQIGNAHYLIAGYEFSHDNLEAKSEAVGKVPSIVPGVGMVPTSYNKAEKYDGYQMRHAVFATMETTLAEDWVFNYGARYTWISNDIDIHNELAGIKDHRDGNDGKVVFNVGASYKGFENLALRANWSQGYRYPLLQELYIDTSMGSMGTTYANPDLKPETSDNFEIGARYSSGIIRVDAAIFYSDADDYITTVAIDENNSRYTNVGKAKTIGFELDAGVQLGDFEPYTVLTILRREYEENGVETTKTGTPKVTARYGVRYNTEYNGALWRADAYAVTQSATESLDVSDPDAEVISYGGATTFNLTGGVSFGPDNAYSFDAGFYNIGDKAYQNNGAIYEAGRHFAVKLNAKF